MVWDVQAVSFSWVAHGRRGEPLSAGTVSPGGCRVLRRYASTLGRAGVVVTVAQYISTPLKVAGGTTRM